MNVLFTKKFNKDISKISDKKLAFRIEDIMDDVLAAKNISGIQNLKKLTGYKNAYRIRIGDYRIGLIIEGNTIIFSAFGNRKEIYRYFP